jgi:hypothetical protein
LLESFRAKADQYLVIAETPSGPLAKSILDYLTYAAAGFRYARLGEIHALGLTEGLRHERLGPAYLDRVLEPSLASLQVRLAAHQAMGELRRDCDLRHASLALLSPLLVLFLHQKELNGSQSYPLDPDAFVREHAAAFVRAYGCHE